MDNKNKRITLAHGNGGRLMRQLIDDVFIRYLHNSLLDTRVDAVALESESQGILMMTTDGFTVQPLEFPGGSIGSLAIDGTVNDLAVSGAEPKYLALNAFIEDGTEMALLERLVQDMAREAKKCGVRVVTGDTKVVGRGECDGVYFATTGIGIKDPSLNLGLDQIRTGDCVLVSGTVGDHGAAVMLARQEYGLSGDLVSDSASVLPVARSLIRTGGLRFMRDPTRGGLATVVNDIARHTGLGVCLHEDSIPVCDQVNAVCEVLGLDPYYLASEGRIVAVIDPEAVPDALGGLSTLAPDARVIGTIEKGSGSVVIRTRFGGERILDELEEDLLPRIC